MGKKFAILLGMAVLFVNVESYAARWTKTDSMTVRRGYLTTTLLLKGKVLAVGGMSAMNTYQLTCELYDTVTGWAFTDSLATRRAYHTANLLLNGKVVVAGGRNTNYLRSCEIYDPVSGLWDTTGSLNSTRAFHTATTLLKGKILVAGGNNGTRPVYSCELYDTTLGTWAVADSMNATREYHSATLLPNGNVLVAGGDSGTTVTALKSCEIYDAVSGLFNPTDSINTARRRHGATLLLNGNVLVVGGTYGTGGGTGYLSSCEIYDTTTGTWDTTGSLNVARSRPKLVLSPDGSVLAVGGQNAGGSLSSCELYNPISGTWALTDSLNVLRVGSDVTMLLDGRVLATGGNDGTNYHYTAELYKFHPAPIDILVETPNGGEVWQGNSQQTVKWRSGTSAALDHFSVLYTLNAPGFAIVNDSISSAHPYTNNYDTTWTIIHTGASRMVIHFDTLFTENGADYVIIYGSNGVVDTTYSGAHSAFWAKAVIGDTVKIRLTSDGSATAYGFDVDMDSCYYSGSTTWDTMALSLPASDTEYLWTVPNVSSTSCLVKVQAFDNASTLLAEDQSDSIFAINAVGVSENQLSKGLFLQNYPNPFTDNTTIRFAIPKAGNVTLSVYNLVGQKMTTLLSGYKEAGEYTMEWKGDFNRRKAPNGIYFYRLETANKTITKKMFLLR